MENPEYRRKIRFVVKLGRALHECGATSQRIERHLANVTRMLGFNGSFLISPTTFTCAFWQEDELDQVVHVERVQPADNNLGRLWEIDRLVESIADGKTGLDEGMEELKRLTGAPPNYSLVANALSWVLIGGSFAALLSSASEDVLAAAALSLVMFLITLGASRDTNWGALTMILCPFVSGILAGGLASLGFAINTPFVILSSVIVFIPGLALTVALTEISTRDLISGSSRLVDAVMVLLKLFFGAAAGMAAVHFIWSPPDVLHEALPRMPGWKTWPAVTGLSLGLGIAFNIPPRKMAWGLASAAVAFLAASHGEAWFGMVAGMFLGALAVGLFSNLFSRVTRGPGSILMTQGIVLLVPGSKTYMILNRWVSGQEILPGASSGNQALLTFLALIAGLLFANALLPTQKSL